MELITVASFQTPEQAHIARLKLESDEIDAYLDNENVVGFNWFYCVTVGGVRVRVAEHHVEAAFESLTPRPRDVQTPMAADPAQPPTVVRCPNCVSADVVRDPWFRRIFYLLLLIPLFSKVFIFWPRTLVIPLWAALFLLRRDWHCYECGNQWRPKAAAGQTPPQGPGARAESSD